MYKIISTIIIIITLLLIYGWYKTCCFIWDFSQRYIKKKRIELEIHINKVNERTIDDKGYYRDGYQKLIHRQVAYNYIYSYPEYPHRFGEYDVHHIDRNKLNNSVNNLQILTREQHIKIHGF